MTNEEMIQDLKQFITATVSQQTADLAQHIDAVEAKMATKDDLAQAERRLNKKIDQVQDAIAETVTKVAEAAEAATDTAVKEHEERYHGRLKHRAA